eukprot:TRINITY_DN68210_c0_g1_i1.p2 TRINITY_DN68210_c0_g1~~TRINITY_DN68210_c0_g1_i1.p2  ORF type:complete len:118 (-),score=8.92 TRINITY_DN68210_c0_g1_i1:23-376(-)
MVEMSAANGRGHASVCVLQVVEQRQRHHSVRPAQVHHRDVDKGHKHVVDEDVASVLREEDDQAQDHQNKEEDSDGHRGVVKHHRQRADARVRATTHARELSEGQGEAWSGEAHEDGL